jgi:hypothetical protein
MGVSASCLQCKGGTRGPIDCERVVAKEILFRGFKSTVRAYRARSECMIDEGTLLTAERWLPFFVLASVVHVLMCMSVPMAMAMPVVGRKIIRDSTTAKTVPPIKLSMPETCQGICAILVHTHLGSFSDNKGENNSQLLCDAGGGTHS